MLNSLYALILTDSLHLPTTIGYFNTRPAACQARQSAHAWLKGESQSVESLKCFSNAAMNILTQCSTMREAKADRKAYIENEHICPMIRKRRYPIHNNTVCSRKVEPK